MEPPTVHHDTTADHGHRHGHDPADRTVVAIGDEHDRGVESLCVGEAA